MTIASEISRLQWAKSNLCTAIENKGVTVWNVTLDCYASCVDAIQQGWGWSNAFVDVLLVGWGGSWGYSTNGNQGTGWWWAGWVKYFANVKVNEVNQVIVWLWGEENRGGSCRNNWTDSAFNSLIAHWWGWGGSFYGVYITEQGMPWASWWGAWGCIWCSTYFAPWKNLVWEWSYSYVKYNATAGTWWWGAWWFCTPCWQDWYWNINWGFWVCYDIEGEVKCYGWGGWWGWKTNYWNWKDWGGSWANCTTLCGCDATTCGSWWGGWYQYCKWWAWWWGLVVVRYRTDWSNWITDATWWCKYVCGDYTIHCFTQDDVFKVWEPTGKYISYLVVGWWGWGCQGWGWGGAVCFGTVWVEDTEFNIIVGAGWSYVDGCASCLCGSCFGVVEAKWGHAPTSITYGWESGSGCKWWNPRWCNWWGWWWAANRWENAMAYTSCYNLWMTTWMGWLWTLWYWGWGEWGSKSIPGGYFSTKRSVCWWGTSSRTQSLEPTNCGGWAWGSCGWGYVCAWACWVVDICYACDGSYGITSATWGNCCYVCNGMCVHRFTSNGTFCIVS